MNDFSIKDLKLLLPVTLKKKKLHSFIKWNTFIRITVPSSIQKAIPHKIKKNILLQLISKHHLINFNYFVNVNYIDFK